MKELWGQQVQLHDQELLRREQLNRIYLMDLKSDNLMLNHRLEAGRYSSVSLPEDIHGGWESPTCQLRGHFLGHWLSAAALRYHAVGDRELRAKAESIVDELELCQKENGNGWAGPIPEKYLHWIAKGKAVWAPQYTIHKTFMGLLDVYQYTGYAKALQVAESFAEWFYDWSSSFTEEEFADILDVETGGMLDIWAQLYQFTKKESHLKLMDRYYRSRLFDPLLDGKDVLTNMHANTTIPEILGCARAYEATGDEKWRKIVTAYWQCAVTERGQFATGGQTSGEIWTPKMELGKRLGDKNQEHCTVYHMMRLASYLFSWTGDIQYADYYEMNLYNGLMAQAYWQNDASHGQASEHPDDGLLTYFLPLKSGAAKGWSSKTNDFFCCHGTLVQANAAHSRGIYYQNGNDLYICQYIDSQITVQADNIPVSIHMKQDTLAGSFHMSSTSSGRQSIHPNTRNYPHHPDCSRQFIQIDTPKPAAMKLYLRIPWWIKGNASISLNGEVLCQACKPNQFFCIDRTWEDGDLICLDLFKGIHTWPLPENPKINAFLYGPVVLAGLCSESRPLKKVDGKASKILVHDNEREWGVWKNSFRTTPDNRDISFKPLYEIGYEKYTVYFPIEED